MKCVVATTVGVLGVLIASRATAQEFEGPIAVVVESGDSIEPVDVRIAIAERTGAPIMSLGRAQADVIGPQVVLTITLADSGPVTVMYWERSGRTRVLSAPVSSDANVRLEVAVSLAVALITERPEERMRHTAVRDLPAGNPYYLAPWRRHLPRPRLSPNNPYII